MPSRPVMKVIQHRDFLVAKPETRVQDVAILMKKHQIGAVLITDNEGCLIGICTERDLAFDIVAANLDPQETPVSAIMTHDPQTIPPDKPFGHALHLMFEGGFRHMPVVDPYGRPMGVVYSRDALSLEILQFGKELERRESLEKIL